MKIVTYLGFDGTCREAFAFYQQVFGGEIKDMLSHADMGIDMGSPSANQRIMHANLEIGDQALMGGDWPVGTEGNAQGFSVSLHPQTDAEADRIFEALADGASIIMPMGETEWSSRFGMLTDKYGTPWIVNSTENVPQP